MTPHQPPQEEIDAFNAMSKRRDDVLNQIEREINEWREQKEKEGK